MTARTISPRRRVLGVLSVGALWAVGLGGIALAILGQLDVSFITEQRLLGALTGLVSIVALSVGLERGLTHEAMEERLTSLADAQTEVARETKKGMASLDRTVAGASGAVLLSGSEDIFEHSLDSIRVAHDTIVAVVVPGSPRAPEWWVPAVVQRLSEADRQGRKLTWRVYLAVSDERRAASRERDIARFTIFSDAGVGETCTVYHIPYEEQTGFDFLVVDGRTTYLTLPSAAGLALPHHVVLFEDSPAIARHLVDWITTLNPEHICGGPNWEPPPRDA